MRDPSGGLRIVEPWFSSQDRYCLCQPSRGMHGHEPRQDHAIWTYMILPTHESDRLWFIILNRPTWAWEHYKHFTKSVSRKSKLALRKMRKHPQYTHMISKLWMSDRHFLPKNVFTLQKFALFYTCDFLGNRYQISDCIAHFLEWENCPPFRFY